MIKQQYRSNIVGDWDFRKKSLLDQGTAAKDASVVGTPIWTGTHKGTSILFNNNVANYLTTTAMPTTSGTIAVVFKASSLTGTFIGSENATGKCYFNTVGNLLSAGIGAQDGTTIKGTTTLQTNVLYHGVLTWNGSTVALYLNGVREYSAAQSGNIPTTRAFYLGLNNLLAGVASPFDGSINEIMVMNSVLTYTEVSQLYTEFLQKAYIGTYNKRNFKFPNILIDGDMNASNTTNWKNSTGAATKVTPFGPSGNSQALRVTRVSGSNYYVLTNYACLTPNKTYSLTGWARGNGGNSNPSIYTGTSAEVNVTNIWVGTTSVLAQRISFTFTAAATATLLKFYGLNSTAGNWVEYEDLLLTEFATVASSNNFKDAFVSLGATSSELNGWAVQTGTWKIGEDTTGKHLLCVTDGQVKAQLVGASGYTTNTFTETGSATLTKNANDLQIDAVVGDKIYSVILTY
jgi:hypothetical protein